MKKQIKLDTARSRYLLLDLAKNNNFQTQSGNNRLVRANPWVVADFRRGVCVTFPVEHKDVVTVELSDFVESILRYKNNE